MSLPEDNTYFTKFDESRVKNVGSEEGHQAPTYSNHHFWGGRDGSSSEFIRNHYDTVIFTIIYIVCNYKYSSIYNYHGIIIFTIRNHYIYM